MKIFDCFTYFNEDLILEIRLQTLDKFVDKFIIIEKAKGMTRIRLKKINRPFLLPAEVKQIQQELNELNTEELEILKRFIDFLYGPRTAPLGRGLA